MRQEPNGAGRRSSREPGLCRSPAHVRFFGSVRAESNRHAHRTAAVSQSVYDECDPRRLRQPQIFFSRSFQYLSLTTRLKIFPVSNRGSFSVKSTVRGHLN
jgi:hypothetical protein